MILKGLLLNEQEDMESKNKNMTKKMDLLQSHKPFRQLSMLL
jgi:hypothetical protein